MSDTGKQEMKGAAEELGVKSLVIDSRKIVCLKDYLGDLEVIHEKMDMLLTGDIDDYFSLTEDDTKLWEFNRARVETEIIMDYMFCMETVLDKTAELLQECEGGAEA